MLSARSINVLFLCVRSQSEKKYKHKAAQEYKKYLSKVLNDEQQGTIARTRSEDEAKAAVGLEGVIAGLTVRESVETVFTLETPKASTEPIASSLKPIGTLDVNAVLKKNSTTTIDVNSANPSGQEEEGTTPTTIVDADPLKALARKKPASSVGRKGLGAKKLTTSAADSRMESFETVEKRSQLVAQETEARTAAKAGESSDNGRVASLLRDLDESKPSIYRSAPASASTTSSLSYSNGPTGLKSSYPIAESHAARDKYSKAKGISSDQFFGRDLEQSEEARSRLQKFGNSSAISSDMLYGNGDDLDDHERGNNYDRYALGSGSSNHASANLDKLKDSVSGFFSDVQRRLG